MIDLKKPLIIKVRGFFMGTVQNIGVVKYFECKMSMSFLVGAL